MLTIGLLPLAGLLLACGDRAAEAPAPSPDASARTAPAPAPPAPDASDRAIERRGKVLEVVPADSYTYARLDYCGNEAWVAGPETSLTVGGIVKMPEGIVQENFESKTLGRTLDAILFVDWFEMTDETEIDCSHLRPAPAPAPPSAAAPPTAEDPPALHGKVLETMVSGGYAYVRLDMCGTEHWAAAQATVIKEGMWVKASEAHEMRDFAARSLGRTFESIYFVNHFDVVPEGPECE